MEFSFNWAYADNRRTSRTSRRAAAEARAAASTSACRRAAPATTSGRGSAAGGAAPAGDRPGERAHRQLEQQARAGLLGAADDQWSYGPVQRVQLLRPRLARKEAHARERRRRDEPRRDAGPARGQVWPIDQRDARQGTAPSRARRADGGRSLRRLAHGAARAGSTGDLDGKIDDPGAAIMDAFWPQLADAVMTPAARPADRRPREPRSRATTRQQPAAPPTTTAGTATSTRTCARCSASASGQFTCATAAAATLAACRGVAVGRARRGGRTSSAAQGPDPAAWRADAKPSGSVRAGPDPADDALDEPPHLPAGHHLHGPPSAGQCRLGSSAREAIPDDPGADARRRRRCSRRSPSL